MYTDREGCSASKLHCHHTVVEINDFVKLRLEENKLALYSTIVLPHLLRMSLVNVLAF